MRALLIAASVAVAATFAGVSQAAVSAAPVPVSIEFTVTDFTPTSFSGDWAASGAINDSGSFVRTNVNFTNSLFNSPVVGVFQSVLVLSSSQGTLTVKEQIRFTPAGVTGTWEIVSGTDAYEHASGHGTFQFVSALHFFLNGVISKTT
jgi:hypothetical protein